MNQIPRIVSTTLLALAAVFSSMPLFAQLPQEDARGRAVSTSDNAAPDLTIAEVEAELAAMEADSGIEDAVKELLRPKYKQAIQALKDAADNAAKAVSYREAIKTAPESASALRAELQALPSAESAAQVTSVPIVASLIREMAITLWKDSPPFTESAASELSSSVVGEGQYIRVQRGCRPYG